MNRYLFYTHELLLLVSPDWWKNDDKVWLSYYIFDRKWGKLRKSLFIPLNINLPELYKNYTQNYNYKKL